ncbi:hypothetical protein GALMADRAFT_240509 [Galerina marginata CBS 339.88]|uniref:Uncharacterized protein n=1 Tax=Galerina marginata (strain CBS 339.88) TaxID=685588 RepID=A0A067TFR9_GALM3|nr:hypothetical protein GALMADRAFT_240509 [Galerina marginata CBS 339.88]
MLLAAYRRKAFDLTNLGHSMAGATQWLARGRSYLPQHYDTHNQAVEVDREDVSGLHDHTSRTSLANLVLSLDPERFTSVGQQPVDLSQSTWKAAFGSPSSRQVTLSYRKSPLIIHSPPDTRGYLYYKRQGDGKSGVSGSLRFRVLPAGASAFEQGSDLQTPEGMPWKIYPYTIVKSPNYSPVASMLLEEGLISQQTLDHLQSLPTIRFNCRSTVLHQLSEPFVANFQYSPSIVYIITPYTMLEWKKFPLYAFAVVSHNSKGIDFQLPYKGSVRMRFEKSPLPEHANTHNVVLRVMDILIPVEKVSRNPRHQILEPVAGELLMRQNVRGTRFLWSVDLDREFYMMRDRNWDSLFAEDMADS